MHKTYLIDSENIGSRWIELLEKDKDSESEFLVFYTGSTPHIDYEHARKLIEAGKKPEFIRCTEGKNALDFQLVTYLGYLLHSDKDKELTILSNDTGFDAVVKFWSERGLDVKRCSCNPDWGMRDLLPVSPRGPVGSPSGVLNTPTSKRTIRGSDFFFKPVSDTAQKKEPAKDYFLRDVFEEDTFPWDPWDTPEDKPVQEVTRPERYPLTLSEIEYVKTRMNKIRASKANEAPKPAEQSDTSLLFDYELLFGYEKKEIQTIVDCLGAKNTSYINLLYTNLYPRETGEAIYKQMKTEGFKASKSPAVKSRKDKVEYIGRLIFKYRNTGHIEVPADIYNFLNEHVKGTIKKNNIKNKLKEKYGLLDIVEVQHLLI